MTFQHALIVIGASAGLTGAYFWARALLRRRNPDWWNQGREEMTARRKENHADPR